MKKSPDNWPPPQNILVILAHPDDPEFFCGATLARWARVGHYIHYCLFTCGEKGSDKAHLTSDEICQLRHAEQRAAADIIGALSVTYLHMEDGYLSPTINMRREVVRIIRKVKPDILVTCDPSNLFPSGTYRLNHPDHRFAGQVVLDAVFPAAGNPHFFPELLHDEGLEPHTPREVWISLTSQPNVILDVTDTWEIKIQALKEHKSQIGDTRAFEERMRSRRARNSIKWRPRYEEKFRVLRFN